MLPPKKPVIPTEILHLFNQDKDIANVDKCADN